MRCNRRRLLQGAAALWGASTLGVTVSRRAHAQSTGARKFLFLFASGGWDATPLDPKFGPDGFSPLSGTDMDPDTFRAELGNLSWSGGPDRPAMDRYFGRWVNQTALVRGVDVHSAGHDSGMRWMMTGTSASSTSDWPTLLAAFGSGDYAMPHVVFSGPAYPGNAGAAVVRGGGGTLIDLIDGSIVGQADAPAPVPVRPIDGMADALVYERAADFADSQQGLGRHRAEDLLGTLDRTMELEGRVFEAGLDDTGTRFLDQCILGTEVMRLGLSRCAMVRIPGGWDTHGGNQAVGGQMDTLFDSLDQLMAHLAVTPGRDARWLLDEVVVVCCSELGRTPRFNGAQGRDHWPFTSMLVAGSGVRGNRVLGATDDGFIAHDVDYDSGQISASGKPIGCENVGTALLQLGGLDPERYLPGVEPLRGLLR